MRKQNVSHFLNAFYRVACKSKKEYILLVSRKVDVWKWPALRMFQLCLVRKRKHQPSNVAHPSGDLFVCPGDSDEIGAQNLFCDPIPRNEKGLVKRHWT